MLKEDVLTTADQPGPGLRHFVPAAQGAVKLVEGETAPLLSHVVDTFFIGGRHLVEREWIAALDVEWLLHLISAEERSSLPPNLQSELSYNEVGRKSPLRLLEVQELYLFSFSVMEQSGETTGPHDPVYLYGTLFGPFPASPEKPPVAVEGQLTVTCADVLEGLVQGAAHAFQYSETLDAGGSESNCFHLMLPAGRQEEIAEGKAVVLAYPLLDAGDATIPGVTNEFLVKRLLYNLLGELKESFERDQIEHPLRRMTLPVPSRWLLEQELQTEGYAIDGDTAVKKASGSTEGLSRVLSWVLGGDQKTLPPEGSIEEFLKLARVALEKLPGWLSARAKALRDRVRPMTATASKPLPPPPRPIIPSPINPTPQPTPKRPAKVAPYQPPAWMQDFIETHRTAGAAAPRLTSAWGSPSSQGAGKPGSGGAGERGGGRASNPPSAIRHPPSAEWMKDFPSDSKSKQRGSKKSKPGASPEWMKDFEQ
jgi:hypothetical protein